MSHTPGPWHVDMNSDEEWLGVWHSDGCVAAIESDNAEADARLIAAAPVYFLLLESLVKAYDRSDAATFDDLMDEVRAAL